MSNGMTKGLVLDHVVLALGGRVLIGPLNLSIAPGEVATLMGPSGSGKSSLLAFLCGTLDPAFAMTGRISLGGHRIDALPPERRGVVYRPDINARAGAHVVLAVVPPNIVVEHEHFVAESAHAIAHGGTRTANGGFVMPRPVGPVIDVHAHPVGVGVGVGVEDLLVVVGILEVETGMLDVV